MSSNIHPILEDDAVLDGAYRVERLIGIGGYAQVYRAVQLDNGRQVAVKVLDISRDPVAADTLRRQFTREAHLAAQLVHPSIVTTYAHGISPDGLPYMVLELLEGRNLTDTLRKAGPFSLARAARLMAECLDGLALAHGKGVIHRDLKPANLFVHHPIADPRRISILDFGMAYLARATGGRTTMRGVLYGTPSYMAPEYLRKGLVSAALDVYQMGLVLVEMVTGRPAVDEVNPAICFERHRAGDLDIPKTLWESPVGSVLKKALRANHTRRYPDAAAFRDALKAARPDLGPEPESLAQSGKPIADSRPAAPVVRPRHLDRALQPGVLLPTGTHNQVRLHPIAEIRKRIVEQGGLEQAGEPNRWDVDIDLPGTENAEDLLAELDSEPPTLQIPVDVLRNPPDDEEEPA